MIPQSAGINGCQPCDLGLAEHDSGGRKTLRRRFSQESLEWGFDMSAQAWLVDSLLSVCVHQVQLWRNQDEYKSFLFSFCCILERLTLAWHHTHQTSSFVLLVAPLCIASLVTKGSAASGGFSVFGEWVWKECLLSVGGAFCCLNAGGHRWKLQVLYFIVASFWSRNLKSLKIVSRKKRKCFSALISMCVNLKC